MPIAVSSFTTEAVRALDGPDWLAARRLAAFERFSAAARPTHEEEIWRYSRVEQLDLERFVPAAPITSIRGAQGLQSEAEFAPSAAVDPYFDELNEAFSTPLVLRIPRGKAVAEPIRIDHTVSAGQAAFPRLVVEAGDDCEVTIIETFATIGDDPDAAEAAVFPVLDLRVGPAARVRYLAVNELGRSTWLIGHLRSTGERDSTVSVGTVSLGGSYARFRTTARAVGQGSSTEQIALYFADGTQMHDFRTIQEHVAPKTSSDLLFKGAVNDTAHSVYTGLIKIGPDARGTAAYQTNRNLTLSKGAWAESVPNLEIETNDVKCSHASTVGPIDAEQLFYLESRGVPPVEATKLLLAGYFGEVFERFHAPADLLDDLRGRIATKLARVKAEAVA